MKQLGCHCFYSSIYDQLQLKFLINNEIKEMFLVMLFSPHLRENMNVGTKRKELHNIIQFPLNLFGRFGKFRAYLRPSEDSNHFRDRAATCPGTPSFSLLSARFLINFNYLGRRTIVTGVIREIAADILRRNDKRVGIGFNCRSRTGCLYKLS